MAINLFTMIITLKKIINLFLNMIKYFLIKIYFILLFNIRIKLILILISMLHVQVKFAFALNLNPISFKVIACDFNYT